MTIERIQVRRDTAANWIIANPILASGEPALETDTRKEKIGDGVTAWTSLAYEESGGGGGGGGGDVTSVAGRTGDVTLIFSDISNSTTVGRAVGVAATTAAARLAIGLSNVDNTSDNLKPVSTAQQDALDLKVDTSRTVAGHALTSNVTVSKSDVGLGNVDNTADTAKPVSTAQQTALNLKADAADLASFVAQKGANSGLASLDSGGKVPSAQLPSYVDDILEYANTAAFPGTGEAGKIYVAQDTNYEYRWGGSSYIRLVASPGTTDALAQGTTNLYFTDALAQAALTSQLAGKVATSRTVAGHALSADVTLVKGDVGLGNVDNTADTAKPVSTDQQTALNLKAPLASPTFTGDPKAPTATTGDNDTSIATTAFVATAVAASNPVFILAPADADPTTGATPGFYFHRTT